MTLVSRADPTARRAKPVRPARARRAVVDEPERISYWRRGLIWVAVPRRAYTSLVLLSAGVLDAGVAMFSIPLAFVVAGLAGGAIGLIGLGITVRGVR